MSWTVKLESPSIFSVRFRLTLASYGALWAKYNVKVFETGAQLLFMIIHDDALKDAYFQVVKPNSSNYYTFDIPGCTLLHLRILSLNIRDAWHRAGERAIDYWFIHFQMHLRSICLTWSISPLMFNVWASESRNVEDDIAYITNQEVSIKHMLRHLLVI